jgi:hypothetical protein
VKYSPKWTIAALFLLVAGPRPVPARAADDKPTTPTLVVRIKSLDGLIADAKHVARLAGFQEQANQFEKMIPAFVGPKGLAGTGLDPTKPWGLYAVLKPDVPNSPVVVLVPVSDEKSFVESLKNYAGFIPGVNVAITKGDDGVYTVKSPAPVPIFFTIADGYMYLTAMRKETIGKADRLPAAQVLPPDDKTVLGGTLRIDTLDAFIKQIALGQFENGIAAAKEKKGPNETPAQTQLKSVIIDSIAGRVKSLLSDGKALSFGLSLDRESNDINLELSLTANPGSPLANDIAGLEKRASRFGRLSPVAGQIALNVAVPEAIRPSLIAAIEEGFGQQQDREKDDNRKALARKIFDVVRPTIKAGEFDVILALFGPNSAGKFTVAGGLKMRDAARADQLARDLVKMIPDQQGRDAFHFDAETINEVKAHRIVPPEIDANAKRLFGDTATALFAFPGDAEVAAFGADPAGALRSILTAKSATGGPFRAVGHIVRLAGLDDQDPKRARELAATAYGSQPEADLVRITLDGGSALRVRASLKGHLITFGRKMDEAKKGNGE